MQKANQPRKKGRRKTAQQMIRKLEQQARRAQQLLDETKKEPRPS